MAEWFRIKKPVPTRAIGKCPWCERHNVILHILAANLDGIGLCCEYICAKCLAAMDAACGIKYTAEQIARDNPEVEVSEDG